MSNNHHVGVVQNMTTHHHPKHSLISTQTGGSTRHQSKSHRHTRQMAGVQLLLWQRQLLQAHDDDTVSADVITSIIPFKAPGIMHKKNSSRVIDISRSSSFPGPYHSVKKWACHSSRTGFTIVIKETPNFGFICSMFIKFTKICNT